MSYADEFRKRMGAFKKKEHIKPVEQKERSKPVEHLCDIHKRSLPVGIDRKVILNVTMAEADWIIERLLKPKSFHDEHRNSKTLIYFEAVAHGALPRERSVFYNKPGVTKYE